MINQILNHIRIPLFRNAYSLVFSSFASSGLGILYWILAARLYDTETVGLNSAALSSIMFLSIVAQLNLSNALNRFLPAAGKRSRRLVLVSYLVSAAMAAAVSLVFLAGLSLWAPKLAFLISNPGFMILFVLSTMTWGIFALQDSALTGIRQAVWVPFENIAFSILKIILLVVFVSLIPAYGILASWLAPLGFALVAINFLLFRRLLPQHAELTESHREEVQPRQIASYVAGDYIGSLFWMAAAFLQPIIVTQVAGAKENAYFYLAWQIAYALFLVSRSMGMSLIAEAAANPVKLNEYSYRVLMQSLRLTVPVVLVIFIGAPWILQLFGREYAAEGTALLRLLSLSAIPQVFVALYLSIARVQRKVKTLIFVQAVLSISVLGMIYLLLGRFGITGIGVAWLVGMGILAAVLIVTRLRFILLSHINMHVPLRFLNILRSVTQRKIDQTQVQEVDEIIPQIITAQPASGTGQLPEQWKAQQVLHTVSDLTVVTIGEEGRDPQALLKLANSTNAVASMNSQKEVLAHLRRQDHLNGFKELLPIMLSEGEVNGRHYVLESMLPGVDARRIIQDPEARARFISQAAAVIAELHQNTAKVIPIGQKETQMWVDDRLRVIREIKTQQSPLHPYDYEVGLLAEELIRSLTGKRLAVSWIHGDYTPGNILVTPDGSKITGVIDWDLAAKDLPMIDLVQLLLATRRELQDREWGEIIRDLLHDGIAWSPTERILLENAQAHLPGDAVNMRTLLLLTWLRHIASTLNKSRKYAANWLWVTKNIEVVLGSL